MTHDDLGKYLSLTEQLERAKRFQEREAIEAIRIWYKMREGRLTKKADYDGSPAQEQIERASEFITEGLHYRQKPGHGLEYASLREIHDILIAVGTEVLLQAIILKREWRYFTKHYNPKRGSTISFSVSKRRIEEEYLEGILSDAQLERLSTVLDIISTRRNNSVHFGFHKVGYPHQDKEIYRVLLFLFRYFFDGNLEIVQILSDRRDELQKQAVGLDYRQIDFDNIV